MRRPKERGIPIKGSFISQETFRYTLSIQMITRTQPSVLNMQTADILLIPAEAVKEPYVLSNVACEFKKRIVLQNINLGGKKYSNAFTGRYRNS